MVRLELTSLASVGGILYAQLFCKSPVNGDVSPFPVIELPNGESVDIFYGEVNLQSQEVNVNDSIRETAAAINNGIFVAISTSADELVLESSDTYYAIRATIK